MNHFLQIVLSTMSISLFLLILIYFWIYGYRYLKKKKIEKYAKIQLWLGPLFGFFTGMMLFQYAISHREIIPEGDADHNPEVTVILSEFVTDLVNFVIEAGFSPIQPNKSFNQTIYSRRIRHLLNTVQEYYQFVDWKQIDEDPLFVIKKHQSLRNWVEQQIKIPKIMRFNIPVVLTFLVTQNGLDEESMAWIKDELNVVSTKDWLGGEVQSIFLINQNSRVVESVKDIKPGDTIALNHALDLIQIYLNS